MIWPRSKRKWMSIKGKEKRIRQCIDDRSRAVAIGGKGKQAASGLI
jgi:hypothetical protein